MKMMNKCLYCYHPVESGYDFHKKCSLAFFGSPTPPVIEHNLSQMKELAKKVVEKSVSVPGIQAKLSMSLIKEVTEKTDFRLTVVGALGGFYILKPPSDRFQEMPENEHATMRIAETFGIKVVPSSLIRLASGELSYITKRIDRKKTGEKNHMIDMFQITEAFDKYKSSMEKVGKSLKLYSENTLLDTLYFFELALFSFLSGNNDMHLKNFSMIKNSTIWTLSPAYDLLNVSIIFPEDEEELALTLSGKRKKIKKDHFIQLGLGLNLTEKQIQGAFKRMKQNTPQAMNLIEISFLSNQMKEAYKKLFEKRFYQLELDG